MLCQLVNDLVTHDFNVWLVSLDPPKAKSFYPLANAVVWHRLGIRSGIANKIHRTNALTRVLRKSGARVLVGFVMSGDKTVYAAAKLAGVKLVAAERNAPSMYHLRYNRFERWDRFAFLHLADRIVVQMPEHANGYPASLHDRISAISNPVPVAKQRAQPGRPDADGRFTLLAVSRLDAVQKGLSTLILAFARIAGRHPDWDLRIIGDGPEETTLRHLANESGLSRRVRIDAPVDNIFAEYAKAQLFVIPSLWEGFPNALAEAMCHGLPAIGFEQAAGVAELIRKGGGWLAKGLDDEAELAETISLAISAPEERVLQGTLAVDGMKEFEPQKQFDQWTDLLTNLAERR